MAHGHDSYMPIPREVPEDDSCAADQGFDAFARTQRVDLLKYLRAHLPTDADAQDAVQESLMRLLSYRDEPSHAWRPLLYRISNNVVGEFYRRSATRRSAHHVPLDSVPLPSEAPELDDAIERSQRRALLRAAILELSPRSREIYLLSVDGLSYEDIGRRCGISAMSVKKCVYRTRIQLAERVHGGRRSAS